MAISESIIQEFAQECAATRKLMERIPEDRLSWKPHEKSMSLGCLATHIAELPGWGQTIIKDEAFDLDAAEFTPRVLGSRKEILDALAKNLDEFSSLLKGKSDEVLMKSWKLTQGKHVIVELPRVVALRSFVLSHVIHHRGQFSVYLRLNNVPLPGIYGPSADES